MRDEKRGIKRSEGKVVSYEQRTLRRTRLCLASLFITAAYAWPRVAGADQPDPFDLTVLLRRVAAEFAKADRDGDGQVTRGEFGTSYQGADRDERIRRFTEFDGNLDDELGRTEFFRLLSPAEERGDMPDPILELEQAALAKLQAAFAEAGDDHPLGRGEWPEKRISRETPPVAEVAFDQWDRDRDGHVAADEGRWLLGVAYGLTQLDGRPIRTAKGRVLSWYYFRGLDKNQDGVLSRDEFVSGHSLGKEKNAAIFERLDVDRNGRLTAEETLTIFWHDTLSHFFAFDRDRDGYLTVDEFTATGWGNMARRSVPAFDDDGDRKLSYREFRATPFANQSSTWAQVRRDADGDGRLSFKEFYLERPPLLVAQSRYFFDRFDLDRDGFLSLAELDFDVDLDKIPAEIAFAAKDTNGDGKLALTEFFSEAKPPDTDAPARNRYEMRLAAEENRFLRYDKDSDGHLDLAEFSESRKAAAEAARRQAKVLSDRKTMLEGNYYVRKGVLVLNEIAFLAIVWLVVRSTGRGKRG